jgi:hypothetical protein
MNEKRNMMSDDKKPTQGSQPFDPLSRAKTVGSVSKKISSNAGGGQQDAATAKDVEPQCYETIDSPLETGLESMAEINKEICAASGIRGERPAQRILVQLAEMLTWGHNEADRAAIIEAAQDMLVELKPANIMEAMLAVQMAGVHETALMFLRQALQPGQTFDACQSSSFQATRLLRLFNDQILAMARLKGRASQQKVTVEHVNVYDGGQAMVGAMDAGREGPGTGKRPK